MLVTHRKLMCWGACLMATTGAFIEANGATVLYADQTVLIERTLADPNDLWVTAADLTRINGFEIKPEGACLADICIPIPRNGDNDLAVTRDGEQWFNVTELARKLQQAYAFDSETNTWSFGQIPTTRRGFLESAEAPDFALVDRAGNTVRLSDFRGKKVLILSWASW